MAVDIFLKLDGVTGESQDSVHKDEIDVLSWSWGMSQSGTTHMGGGGGSGKVSVQDLSLTKYLDASSPTLQKFCANGKHVKWARFTARRAGTEGGTPLDYLFVDFGDLIISSYDISGVGTDGWPQETIAFSYGQIVMTYKQLSKGIGQGPIQGGYDAEKNKKIAAVDGAPGLPK